MSSVAQAEWYAKLYEYSDGEAEATLYPSSAKDPGPEGGIRKRWDISEEERQARDKQNRERTISRARCRLRRAIQGAGLDTLWTATYEVSELSLAQAKEDFARFARRMRETFGRFPYAVVYERQEGRGQKEGNAGSWHVHFATRGFYDWSAVRRLWGKGHVQYQKPKRSGRWVPAKMAGYLAKYLGKAMQEAQGDRLYSRSEGLEIPEGLEIRFASYGAMMQWVEREFGQEAFVQENDEGYPVWVCSW